MPQVNASDIHANRNLGAHKFLGKKYDIMQQFCLLFEAKMLCFIFAYTLIFNDWSLQSSMSLDHVLDLVLV